MKIGWSGGDLGQGLVGVQGLEEFRKGGGESAGTAGGVGDEGAAGGEVGFQGGDVGFGHGEAGGAGDVGDGGGRGVEGGRRGDGEAEVGVEVGLGQFGEARPGAGFRVPVGAALQACEGDGADCGSGRGNDGEGLELGAEGSLAGGIEEEVGGNLEVLFRGEARRCQEAPMSVAA